MFKRISVAAVLVTVGLLAIPASAASFSIEEPLDTPGPLDSSWIVSGENFTPTVVTNAGDTPENALRLTEAAEGQSGFVLYDTAIPTSKGIDITFHQAQWGGNGADGIVFFVKDATNTTNTPGAAGGGMGYSPSDPTEGLPGALLGIGLDAYGSFGSTGGSGCDSTYSGTTGTGNANAVTLRGPGNGLVGYCLLADSYLLTNNGNEPLINSYGSRKDADRKVRVVIDAATKTDPKVTLYYQDQQIIQVALPEAFNTVSNVKVGFSSGTGGLIDNHDVWGLTSQVAETVVDEEDNTDTGEEEQLADTGLDGNNLWFGAALSLMLIALGSLAIRKSMRS